MLTHWIWLAHRPGVRDWMKIRLLEHFSDPEDIFFADREAYSPVDGLTEDALAGLEDKDLSSAQEILDRCEQENLKVLTLQDERYPERLKNIYDPPLVLYYKGTMPRLDDMPVIGVVGTRSASPYGIQTARQMGTEIAACGGAVVSGLAKGIDSAAMSGALNAGGTVIGVLGCGADIVYPASNRALFKDVERYGCILSEFAPGMPPAKWTFPKRNRIISGLSNGVLVVEAPEKSGALITARLAAEQGRDVFAVPGNVNQSGCLGSNRLMQDGAMVAMTGWDVMREYESQYPKVHRAEVPAVGLPKTEERPLEKVAQKPVLPGKKSPLKKNLEKKTIDNGPPKPYSDVKTSLPKLSEDEKIIVSCLQNGQRLVDEVIAESNMKPGKILGLLTMMELKGILKRLPGKRITLK